jgi:ketosteroid isomerase-like protein
MDTLTPVSTDQNIKIVQQGFTDFMNGNISGITDSCSNNVKWGSFENPGVPYESNYQGKEGVSKFFGNLNTYVDFEKFEPREFYADKNKVFVKGYHGGKAKTTGKSFGHEYLMEFTLEDGKICNFFAWLDTRDQAASFTN